MHEADESTVPAQELLVTIGTGLLAGGISSVDVEDALTGLAPAVGLKSINVAALPKGLFLTVGSSSATRFERIGADRSARCGSSANHSRREPSRSRWCASSSAQASVEVGSMGASGEVEAVIRPLNTSCRDRGDSAAVAGPARRRTPSATPSLGGLSDGPERSDLRGECAET